MANNNLQVMEGLSADVVYTPGTVQVIAIGGLGEIGKNTMIIRYGNDMLLVDAGLAFPSEDMPGVDLVLPDLSYLVANEGNVKGLVITHGHEDHIGGIPFILKKMTIPVIYGPALALGLLEGKLSEEGLSDRTQMRKVQPRQQVKVGCFSVQFIRCTHSIADAYSLIIRTPAGTLVHTGDFKFDFTPVDGEQFDIASLTSASEDGVLLLMSDSTNVEREGYTPSEKTVWRKLDEVFANATKRIIVTTFASNVHRIKQILQAAMKYDRKVAILGRSMLNLAGIARELGYMTFPDGLLVRVEEINQLPLDKVVILTTGSQGEPLSALTRIASGGHKQVRIVPGDTVIISATPIPGNERSIANTINKLFLLGADVIYGRQAGVHVSGHGCREEQKLMLNICKPKFFMPIHGEYRMLVRHAELAVECGVQPDNVFVMDNGDVLEIAGDHGKLVGKVQAGKILVDSSRAWELDLRIIEERRQLAGDGVITVALTVGAGNTLLAGPDITIRGLTVPRGMSSEELVINVRSQVVSALKQQQARHLNDSDLKDYLLSGIQQYLVERLKSLAWVQLVVQEVKLSSTQTKRRASQLSAGE